MAYDKYNSIPFWCDFFLIASRSIWTAALTWRCRTRHTEKEWWYILRQLWFFSRSLSFILSIRELGLRHDFEVYNHGGGQGIPGLDGHHLRRHYLQRGYHHDHNNYCCALYLQLLGWQRRCGGFLYRNGSRLLLLRFRDNKIISTEFFHRNMSVIEAQILKPNETNDTLFSSGTILLAALLYYLLRCCFTGMCCGPEPCDFMECCRSYERPR